MNLPASLQWIEIDLPGILDYKEEILRRDKPVCALERIRLDLSDVSARREVFAKLGSRGNKALMISEGLIVYFTADEVGVLAQDLATPPSFQRWVTDLCSPGLLKLLKKKMGAHELQTNALSITTSYLFAVFVGVGRGVSDVEVDGLLGRSPLKRAEVLIQHREPAVKRLI